MPLPEPSVSYEPDEDWSAPTDAPATAVEPNVLVENLEIPWDISVASNGDLFLSERVGRISRFSAGELRAVLDPADAIDAGSVPPGDDERPWWVEGGEGGTLGLAVHPDYPVIEVLYVYYTANVGDERTNRVSWFDLSADDPASTETVLIDEIPAHRVHNGGRLEFGPRGALWVTTGTAAFDSEAGSQRAADPASLAGKVLRVTSAGDPAPDNPDLGTDADRRVFTYGHRNPQGLAWLPDGTPVSTEHGPSGRDELNRLEAGANYGWPDVRTGAEYEAAAPGVHQPLASSRQTTWAPTGCRFYTGDAVPSWRNRLLVGGLASQQVLVATLTPPGAERPPVDQGRRFDADWLDDGYTVTAHTALEDVLGRVRHLEQGHDGSLYAITSNRDGRANQPFPRERDDVLVRLEVPA
jgi:glucose/arabinose dehydrogenase